jgi:peptidoglycan hydrolase-like amidase
VHALLLAQLLRIGVFGLFQPTELELRPALGDRLTIEADGRALVLEGAQTARLRAEGDLVGVVAGGLRLRMTAVRTQGPNFTIAVPGKIERRFRGSLEVTAQAGTLAALVAMDMETAVASAVAAESPAGAPLEALKAQAVATRSYYAAMSGRHSGFDFCDTTHCQFLREPPGATTAASRAAAETRTMVIEYGGAPVAGFFTASCGGRTRPLEGARVGEYPYYAVECEACRRGPPVECTYCDRSAGAWANRRGTGAGHGIGLCQMGAVALAREGADFLAILNRYFPNTRITGKSSTY